MVLIQGEDVVHAKLYKQKIPGTSKYGWKRLSKTLESSCQLVQPVLSWMDT